MTPPVSRRDFLRGSAGAAASLAAAPLALADDQKPTPPSEKVVVALIGCGGMGRTDLREFLRAPEVELAMLCDVDTRRIDSAIKYLKDAAPPAEKIQTCLDFRRVLDRKDIDAVIIGTPDHWHALPLIYACQAGKDVYCEKPLAHNIVEGRAMVNAARRNKRVVQIGTQQRSGTHFQDAVKHVQSGKLGKVHVCRTWICSGNNSPDGDGNPPDSDPPKEVDYNFWLGPAPRRPFNKVRFHGSFRWFFDYGNGLCNDWGVHLNDIVLWAMKVQAPLAVCASGGKYVLSDLSDTPDTLEVVYDYPGFTHVYTARRCCTNAGFRGRDHGMEFQGSDGTLVLDRGGWEVLPETRDRMPRTEAVQHAGSEQYWPHVQNFLACIKSRARTASDIEDMHRATVTCHLANISYKLGRKVHWDPATERCRLWHPPTRTLRGDDVQANAFLFREMRKPWSLPT